MTQNRAKREEILYIVIYTMYYLCTVVHIQTIQESVSTLLNQRSHGTLFSPGSVRGSAGGESEGALTEDSG